MLIAGCALLPARAASQLPQLASSYEKLQAVARGEIKQLTIGIVGDSVANNKPRFIMPRFFAAFPARADRYPTFLQEGDAWIPSGSASYPYDHTFSFNGMYYSIGSAGSVYWGSGGVAVMCNRIVVYYAKGPGSGQFKLQRSTSRGLISPASWVDEPGYEFVDTQQENKGWGKIILNLPLGPAAIRVVHVSGGRVVIPVRPIFQDKIQPGVVVRNIFRGGVGLFNAVQWDRGFALDYLRELDLDLCFFEAKESPDNYAGPLEAMQSVFHEAKPETEWIFIGSSPLIPIQDPNNTKQIAENAILRAHAEAHGAYFFDGYSFVGSYERMVEMGWQGDGIHESLSCSEYLSGKLWESIGYLIAPRLEISEVGGVPVVGNEATINFGNVNYGQTAVQTVKVTNIGTVGISNLSLGATGSGFSTTALSSALAPGISQNLDITLSSSPGNHAMALLFTGGTPSTSAHLGLVGTRHSSLQTWRRQYFGAILNAGNAADDADPDHDGQKNMMEFATGANPSLPGAPSDVATVQSDGSIVYDFNRRQSAVEAGWQYIVEWSNTMKTGSWSASGVTAASLSTNGDIERMRAVVPAPTSATSTRFTRLRVIAPAE